MTSLRLRHVGAVVASLVLASACTSATPASTGEDPKCTPGAYVFCLCIDGSSGTKLCNDDAQTFGVCENCQGDGVGAGGRDPVGLGGNGGSADVGGAGGHRHGAGGDSAGADAAGGDTGVGGDGSAGSGGTAPLPGDACPGIPLAVVPGTDTLVSGTTVGARDDYFAPCAATAGADVVYTITPSISGTLTARVQPQAPLDAVVFAWTGACGGTPSGCIDAGDSGNLETLAVPVQANVPTFLVVDGNGPSGGFAMTLSLSPSVAGDQCPGTPVAIDASGDVTIAGDTTFAHGDELGTGSCATAAGNDVVYSVTAGEDGMLTVTLSPSPSLDAEVYVRSGDCLTGPQEACAEGNGPGGVETATVTVAAGETVSVVVDGKGPSFGPFSVAFHLAGMAQKTCGDGAVEAPEQCDGNAAATDGCGPDCQVVANPTTPPGADCPGEIVHVWPAGTSVTGSTALYSNFDQGTCGGGTANDRFYQIVPELSGTLQASISNATFDVVLYAREGECIAGTQLACAHNAAGTVIELPVTAHAPVWIAVDGYNGQSGTFQLGLAIH